MKNSILAIGMVAAGLIAAPALSQAAEDGGGFFVNGSIGSSTLNEGIYDDSDTGYQFNAGYRWAMSPEFAFGLEGGYTDLGKFSPKNDIVYVTPGPTLSDAEISGWTIGANVRWTVAEAWYISGRLGWFNADVNAGYLDTTGIPDKLNDSSGDWYAGLGTGYNFTPNFSLGLSYDWYNAGVNAPDNVFIGNNGDQNFNSGMFSLTGEVRF